MQQTATWNFAPPGNNCNNRLTELMKSFGCADVIAPVDAEAFGKRAGELIRWGVRAPKALLQIEEASLPATEQTERISLLTVLHNAPWFDRLTLVAAAAASLLVGAGAVFFNR